MKLTSEVHPNEESNPSHEGEVDEPGEEEGKPRLGATSEQSCSLLHLSQHLLGQGLTCGGPFSLRGVRRGKAITAEADGEKPRELVQVFPPLVQVLEQLPVRFPLVEMLLNRRAIPGRVAMEVLEVVLKEGDSLHNLLVNGALGKLRFEGVEAVGKVEQHGQGEEEESKDSIENGLEGGGRESRGDGGGAGKRHLAMTPRSLLW